MDKVKLVFTAIFGLLIPGFLLNYAYTLVKLLTPLADTPLSQLISEVLLLKTGEFIMLGLAVITLPGAVIVALSMLIFVVRLWLD